MATYYLYSPIDGKSWGQACYCKKSYKCGGVSKNCRNTTPCYDSGCSDGASVCNHFNIIFGGMLDISGTLGNAVNFYASSNIKSIEIKHVKYCCGSRSEPWTWGLEVHVYCNENYTGYIGKVLYCHVENRIAAGKYNTGLWGKQIATLPKNCNCACSKGIHVHMESPGTSNSFSCDANLTKGSTWVYKWVIGNCAQYVGVTADASLPAVR